MNNNRLKSIDRFRGVIVFCMCFFILAGNFPVLGLISKVANNSATTKIMLFNNFSLADLVDPIFIFLISLSYQSSFNRRYNINKKNAYIHFITRYLIFVGLGSIMVSAEDLFMNTGKDPFIFMTILMFISIIFFILKLIILFIKKTPKKIKIIVNKILDISLLTLGIIGVILAIRDDILLFTGNINNLYKHFSILHEIGITGLLLIPFLKLNLPQKIISWFILLFLYALFQMQPGVIEQFDVIVLGGLIGCFGWLIIMLGGVIFMNFYEQKNNILYYGGILILFLLSIILFNIVELNTSAVSINYVIFSLLIAVILFKLFNLFNNLDNKYDFFMWWGRNPLPLFGIFLIFRLIEKIWNPSPNTNFMIGFSFVFGCNFILSLIAYKLYKKNIILKI